MDSLVADLLDFHSARHAELNYNPDMPTLARTIGTGYRMADSSFMTPERIVNVNAYAGRTQQRIETAHENSHALTAEEDIEGNSYVKAVRYFHASVPDLEDHLELLADHGGDRFLMPDALVEEILRICGHTARAVWELSRFADVTIKEALRRIVYFKEDGRCGGFFSCGKFIQEAQSYRYSLPFWLGQRIPEPHILIKHQITTFEIPNHERQLIGLVVVDEFEAA